MLFDLFYTVIVRIDFFIFIAGTVLLLLDKSTAGITLIIFGALCFVFRALLRRANGRGSDGLGGCAGGCGGCSDSGGCGGCGGS